MNITNIASFDERLELARRKSAERMDCQVIELLRPYVATRPHDGEAWHLLGEALGYTGRYVEAIESLKRALAVLPDRARSRIWCSIGKLAQVSASPAEAKPWFDLATREDPVEGAWVLRGENLLLLQETAEAIRCFTRASALASESYHDAVLGVARAYRAMQDYAKALRCAQQVLRKYPASAQAQRIVEELSPLVEEPAGAVAH